MQCSYVIFAMILKFFDLIKLELLETFIAEFSSSDEVVPVVCYDLIYSWLINYIKNEKRDASVQRVRTSGVGGVMHLVLIYLAYSFVFLEIFLFVMSSWSSG